MKIKQEISAEILNAATAVLSPYILDLTASVRSSSRPLIRRTASGHRCTQTRTFTAIGKSRLNTPNFNKTGIPHGKRT